MNPHPLRPTLFSFNRKSLTIKLFLIGLLTAPSSLINAGTWRRDVTNEQVLALAQQQQFAGAGVISSGFTRGSGVAIAPGWVMTAAHVVRGNSQAIFTLGGVQYTGVPLTTDGTPFRDSDVALIRLNENSQLPASTPFIAPNQNLNPVGELVWISGAGQFGPRRGGPLSGSDGAQRAGTNIITGRDLVPFAGRQNDAILYQQNDTSPNSTAFEISTAPGDSGGPTYLQHNNQWYVVGTTMGVILDRPNGNLRVRPAQADVATVYDWIEATTGLTFAPQPSPTELFFDANFVNRGIQTTPLPQFSNIWDTTRPMFTGGPDGFSYTWENDFAPSAVFGTPTTVASTVRVQDDITFGGIRFDETFAAEFSAPFQLSDDGGSLRAVAGGATIETRQSSVISANLTGGQSRSITKTGDADLLLNGDNDNFAAEIVVADGTLIAGTNSALGVGGFNTETKTTVNSGATLRFNGSGITTNEHLRIRGTGHNGNGALEADSGNHTLTERIALQSDSTINAAAGSSLTIGGNNGHFFSENNESYQLTQTGDGTVVYDNVSSVAALIVTEGVAAGQGGVDGAVTVQSGGELKPGDNANSDAIGTFKAGNLTLEADSMLTIDLDPLQEVFDQLIIDGTIELGGLLGINLKSAPTIGQSFLIINNDLTDLVNGQFAGPGFFESTFDGEQFLFAVDYSSGLSNNDVSLIAVSAIPEPSTQSFFVLLISLAGLQRRRLDSPR
jgi:hypothetical protein